MESNSPLEIIAHRGASEDAPENTLAALSLGWQQGADAVEIDVRLSKDRHIVVIHDSNTKRTANRDRDVAEQTVNELRKLDAGAWKGAQWRGEKIPTLAEAIAMVPNEKRLFIELKSGPEIVAELKNDLEASGQPHRRLVIIAFDDETLRIAKELLPEIKMFLLASPIAESQGDKPSAQELIARAKAAGVDGLNLHYKFAFDSAFISEVRNAGFQLYIWTVDDFAVAQRLAKLGVNGITTNRPAKLRGSLA